MLEMLRRKIRDSDRKNGTDYERRLYIVKSDLRWVRAIGEGHFDAAVMINVLYAVDDREQVLKEVRRLLRPGGILALSTSHSGTDVKKLFDRLQSQLTKLGMFGELRENFADAFRRHEELDELIHRDDRKTIKQHLERAGFEIAEWEDDQYADAVVVVKAIRH